MKKFIFMLLNTQFTKSNMNIFLFIIIYILCQMSFTKSKQTNWKSVTYTNIY